MKAICLMFALFAAECIETTLAACRPTVKMDLTITVDSSSSVCNGAKPCPNWYSALDFCKYYIVNGLTIGSDNTRVSFLNYGSEVKLEWAYDRLTSKSELSAAIDKVIYKGGEAEAAKLASSALVVSQLFLPFSGDRFFVPNVFIAITDGAPLVVPKIAFDLVKKLLHAIGVKLIVVCVTPGCTESFAKGFDSEPVRANVTYFLVNGFLNLDKFREIVVKQLCAILD